MYVFSNSLARSNITLSPHRCVPPSLTLTYLTYPHDKKQTLGSASGSAWCRTTSYPGFSGEGIWTPPIRFDQLAGADRTLLDSFLFSLLPISIVYTFLFPENCPSGGANAGYDIGMQFQSLYFAILCNYYLILYTLSVEGKTKYFSLFVFCLFFVCFFFT